MSENPTTLEESGEEFDEEFSPRKQSWTLDIINCLTETRWPKMIFFTKRSLSCWNPVENWPLRVKISAAFCTYLQQIPFETKAEKTAADKVMA